MFILNLGRDSGLLIFFSLSRIIPNWYFFVGLWGRTKSLGTAATSGLLYKPQMIDEGDCGTIGGMKIGRNWYLNLGHSQ
jgi:hypothetical protein